ncbi:MAG: 6-phospho-alpha-glucosidase [Erysipelotrichaceae bacterium]
MKKYKICLIGAGSRYSSGILRMLVENKERFPLEKIVLFDVEPERLAVVGEYTKLLCKEYYEGCEVVYTTNPEEAYPDIDFAFVQIRPGRLTLREQDEKIALRHGCVGQETCGPGGFAYGMRSIPAMIDIITKIREHAPEAWIINYSNPAAIVAEATKRVFKDDHRIINICDMPIAITNFYAHVIGKQPSDLDVRYFGLNHYGWFTNLFDKVTGEDMLPKVREILKTPMEFADEQHTDKSWVETFGFLSTMINDYEDYLPNTYLQYYLYPKYIVSKEDPNYTRANEVMDGKEQREFEMLKQAVANGKLKGTAYELKPVHTPHSAYIVDLATSICNNENNIFLIMTENKGIVSNFSEGAMVEVPCRLGANGVEPLHVGEIPAFQKGLLETQYAYEKLTVDACLQGSYKYAKQALVLNRCVNDTQTAEALLQDYIIANKGYWPELK